MISALSISDMYRDYNDGILLVSDWVNPVSSYDFPIKYSLLLIDGVIFGVEGGGGSCDKSYLTDTLIYSE